MSMKTKLLLDYFEKIARIGNGEDLVKPVTSGTRSSQLFGTPAADNDPSKAVTAQLQTPQSSLSSKIQDNPGQLTSGATGEFGTGSIGEKFNPEDASKSGELGKLLNTTTPSAGKRGAVNEPLAEASNTSKDFGKPVFRDGGGNIGGNPTGTAGAARSTMPEAGPSFGREGEGGTYVGPKTVRFMQDKKASDMNNIQRLILLKSITQLPPSVLEKKSAEDVLQITDKGPTRNGQLIPPTPQATATQAASNASSNAPRVAFYQRFDPRMWRPGMGPGPGGDFTVSNRGPTSVNYARNSQTRSDEWMQKARIGGQPISMTENKYGWMYVGPRGSTHNPQVNDWLAGRLAQTMLKRHIPSYGPIDFQERRRTYLANPANRRAFLELQDSIASRPALRSHLFANHPRSLVGGTELREYLFPKTASARTLPEVAAEQQQEEAKKKSDSKLVIDKLEGKVKAEGEAANQLAANPVLIDSVPGEPQQQPEKNDEREKILEMLRQGSGETADGAASLEEQSAEATPQVQS